MNEWELVKSTRKDHTCLGCLQKIPAKSSAWYFKAILEGEFSYGYICLDCYEFLKQLPCDYFEPYGVWYEGELGIAKQEEGWKGRVAQ